MLKAFLKKKNISNFSSQPLKLKFTNKQEVHSQPYQSIDYIQPLNGLSFVFYTLCYNFIVKCKCVKSKF